MSNVAVGISSGVLLAAALVWRSLFTLVSLPLWMYFMVGWVGCVVPLLGIAYFQAGQWKIIDEITNWDRVHELLGEAREPGTDSSGTTV